jgi:hypothetical protein
LFNLTNSPFLWKQNRRASTEQAVRELARKAGAKDESLIARRDMADESFGEAVLSRNYF